MICIGFKALYNWPNQPLALSLPLSLCSSLNKLLCYASGPLHVLFALDILLSLPHLLKTCFRPILDVTLSV